ncbi:hypothetical protein [Actinomyces slackii]|uniref:hypothetical protein n=1 Tax=Actinomyces slackii TaxID=52774 RepID=UPI000F83588F|nr:hypothetical protein [Actinomyces slackii]
MPTSLLRLCPAWNSPGMKPTACSQGMKPMEIREVDSVSPRSSMTRPGRLHSTRRPTTPSTLSVETSTMTITMMTAPRDQPSLMEA